MSKKIIKDNFKDISTDILMINLDYKIFKMVLKIIWDGTSLIIHHRMNEEIINKIRYDFVGFNIFYDESSENTQRVYNEK
jgi:hypothetical protein